MKKLLLTILAVILTFTMVFGCGEQDGPYLTGVEGSSRISKNGSFIVEKGDYVKAGQLKDEIAAVEEKRKEARKMSKLETDKHANFNRAAKPFLDAEKLLKQKENYTHFEEIAAMYDAAKARISD